jgi:hypothetical protein
MRYSRLTSTLLSGAFILVLLGSVSASSRTKMTAEFDLMPSLEKAGRVEKAKRQGNPKIEAMSFLWEKNSDLLPMHCRVIAADTANLDANYSVPFDGDSLIPKKMLSPKMQPRHSDRWFDPPSKSGEKASGELFAYLQPIREWLSFVSIPETPWRDSCAELIERTWLTASSFGNGLTTYAEAKYERSYGDQVTIDPLDHSISNLSSVIVSSDTASTANLATCANLDYSSNLVVITTPEHFKLFAASHWQSNINNGFGVAAFPLDYPGAKTQSQVNSTLPDTVKAVSKPTKSLQQQVIALFEVEMKSWADSFRHIAKQFSRLRGVF